MIWTSIPLMTAIDLSIVAMIGIALWALIWNRKILQPLAKNTGPTLVALGLSSVGLFYFADLMIMHALPFIVPMADAKLAMESLHHNLSWLFILVAVVSIVAGFRLIIRDQKALIQKVEISKRELIDQLAERKQSEGVLKESQARLANILDNSPAPIYFKDLEGRFLVANKRYQEMYDVKFEDIKGKTSKEIFGEELGEGYFDHDQEVLNSRKVIEREENYLGRTYLTLKFPITDSNEVLLGLGGVETDVTEIKAVEEAFRESESLFRSTIDHLPIGLNVKDTDGRYLLVNKTTADRYGLLKEDFVGKTIKELFPEAKESNEASRAQEIELIKTRKVTRRVQEFEFQDGTLHALLIDKFPIFDDEGNLVSIGVTTVDITEQREAERALKESESLFRATTDHLPIWLNVKDIDGRYLLANKTMADELGLPQEDFIGKTNKELFPEAKESNKASRAQEIKLIKTRKVTRRVQIKKFHDETLHTLLIDKFPIFDDEGNHVSIGITGIDITEQKEAEQKLKESGEHFRSLVDHLADAIFVHDSKGRFRLVNREACRSLGFEEEELLGMSVPDIEVGLTEKEVSVLSKLVNSNETLTIERRHRRKDGTEFDVEVVLSPYVMDGKNLVMASARDITERKETQAQLIQSAKLATLGEMSAGMAHELSQPLNIIRFAAEGSLLRMARGAFTAEDQKAQFETIDSQCQRMANIVDHMRVFSRKDSAPLEIFNPMETVNEAIKLISSQFAVDGIEISSRLPSRMGKVQGRKIQLEQVILNLFSNARDSILEKQKSLGEDDAWFGKIDIAARRHNASKTVIITVGDDGLGIPDNIFDRIFEPFYTSKAEGDGTGLGLSVSYGIIEGMSGKISVEKKKTGALFKITLPLVTGRRKALSSQAPGASKENSSVPGEPRHILIVDDEKEAANALARFLEDQGHRVSTASDGVEAYDMFVRDSADMVVTDIRMPRMDGEQLIKRLRERTPHLPIIIVTGHLGPIEILDNSIKNKIAHVFKKPVSLTELGEAIQNIIRGH